MGQIVQIPWEQESPEVKLHVKDYWTKRADGFQDLREAELESNKRQRWEQEILSQLPKGESLNILDVGCGCGFFGIILAAHGHHVTGIDLTPSMIDRGKELAEKYGAEVDLQVMDAEHLDFPDETFDVVISRNLTWTLPHPADAYREWNRVLKAGGVILNYDAEYAKDHHKGENLPKDHAHHEIGDTLKAECHKIYHMLTISSLSRPQWDVEVLKELGMKLAPVDTEISGRIYREQDRFFVPDQVFRIRAEK